METTTYVPCEWCGQLTAVPSVDLPMIKLPPGPDRTAGIWFGDVHVWVWFDDELFCSYDCFLSWLAAKRRLE